MISWTITTNFCKSISETSWPPARLQLQTLGVRSDDDDAAAAAAAAAVGVRALGGEGETRLG